MFRWLSRKSLQNSGLNRTKSCLAVEVLEGRELPAIAFIPPTMVSDAGATPSQVLLADLNSDGKADLISTDDASMAWRIFGNDGQGNLAYRTTLALGTSPGVPRAADLNGDSKLDLITQAGPGRMRIHRNAGNFSFSAVQDISTSMTITDVVAADFNGDGRTDLAAYGMNPYGSPYDVYYELRTWLNNGTSMSAGPVTRVAADGVYQAGPRTRGLLAAGDLNNDGRTDLVISLPGAGERYTLLGTGAGSFQVSAAGRRGVGESPVLADFNKDGKLDLAVAQPGSNHVVMFRGNGQGEFEIGYAYSVGVNPRDLVVGDFDRDGNLDIVSANGGGVGQVTTGANALAGDNATWLRGRGDGQFDGPVHIAVGNAADKRIQPSSIAAADLNGDGWLDLAAGHDYVDATRVTPPSTSVSLMRQAVNPGSLRFSAPAYDVNEDAGSVIVTVERVGGSDGVIDAYFGTFGYSNYAGGATPGIDYTHTTGSLRFEHGETRKTIRVSILNDMLLEGTEKFHVDLYSTRPDGGQTWLTRADVNIGDNDAVISGRLWDDRNGNRVRNTNEGYLAGWTVFIDANNNGVMDANEARTRTNSDGVYSFVVGLGTHRVRVAAPSTWVATTSAVHTFTLVGGQSVTGNFGYRRRS